MTAADARLADRLLAPQTLPHLLADCDALIVTEVGKRGVTLRTAFNLVRRLKPDLVERALEELLPEFVAALEPFYAACPEPTQAGLRDHLVARDAQVADALLTVSDRRARRIRNKPTRSAYQRLRGRAQRELVASMPATAATLAKHAA